MHESQMYNTVNNSKILSLLNVDTKASIVEWYNNIIDRTSDVISITNDYTEIAFNSKPICTL